MIEQIDLCLQLHSARYVDDGEPYAATKSSLLF
jgi:hypothetical protein